MSEQGDSPPEREGELDVVLVNAPPADAKRIARALVEARLAACVNVIPGVTSIYRWEGAVHEDSECTLVIKTRRALVQELTARVRELHPYAVPEVVALPIAEGRGNAPYLAWVIAETRPPSPRGD